MKNLPVTLSREDALSLAQAFEHLENPSFAARLSHIVGTPIEMGLKLLPKTWYAKLHRGTESAIWKALDMAVHSLQSKRGKPRNVSYKLAGAASGAVSGFFGAPALLLELPFSTTVMLRAIADIAQGEGEDLNELETRLACLEVFALGGRSNADDVADIGYYGIRLALQAPVANASRFLVQGGVARGPGSPLLVDFIAAVSKRFGVTFTEKAVAEAIPLIGALGGAFVNAVFIQHFQDMARGHFTVRRLERKYGPTLVRREYGRLNRTQLPHQRRRTRQSLAPAAA